MGLLFCWDGESFGTGMTTVTAVDRPHEGTRGGAGVLGCDGGTYHSSGPNVVCKNQGYIRVFGSVVGPDYYLVWYGSP